LRTLTAPECVSSWRLVVLGAQKKGGHRGGGFFWGVFWWVGFLFGGGFCVVWGGGCGFWG
ncbi:hypothetical protein RA268_27635, partial [Pseudomonas syringae pv. tagetis]